MHFQPVRCLAISLGAVLALFCAETVRAEKGPPAANPAVEGTGVRLIEVSPDPESPRAAAIPAPADDSGKLVPIPESPPLGPVALEACSFHGVTPGVSSVDAMEKAWGPPKETRRHGKALVELHAVAPFPRVEVHCSRRQGDGDRHSFRQAGSRRQGGPADSIWRRFNRCWCPTNWARSSAKAIRSGASCSPSRRPTRRARRR